MSTKLSLFEIDDNYYADLLTRLYPQEEMDEKLKTKSNWKVLVNARSIGTALKEQGLDTPEIEKRIKQYLKLNFK